MKWQAIAAGWRDRDAHLFQRCQHAPHRPAAERGISDHLDRHVVASDHTHHQPRASTGIAEIERGIGLRQAARAAPDHFIAARGALGSGAKLRNDARGVEHVFRLQQARNACASGCQSAEHQRAMRDRLVAGHPYPARQRPRTMGGQRAHISIRHWNPARVAHLRIKRSINNRGRPLSTPEP